MRSMHIACMREIFFALDTAQVGAIDLVYDRAALIALPPNVRADYARHLQTLLTPTARIFLITLEYESGANERTAVWGDCG